VAAALLAFLAALAPPLLAPLATPVLWLAGPLRYLATAFAGLPAAQLHLGKPAPLLGILLIVVLIPWLLTGCRRWLLQALGRLGCRRRAHGALLRSDQMVLVHQLDHDWITGESPRSRRPGSKWRRSTQLRVSGPAGARPWTSSPRLGHAPGSPGARGSRLLAGPLISSVVTGRRPPPRRLGLGQRLHSPGLELAPLFRMSRAALLRLGGRP